MQTQIAIRKRFIEAQRMPLRKVSERHKRRMEERRLKKIETEGEGKMILRAERLEKEGLRTDAMKCWLDLGMQKRAMEVVRKNHSDLDALRTASASGLQEELKQLFIELGEKLGKRQASDLAHHAGLHEEAYNLALEHLATTSEEMPLVFQGKSGRKFAAFLESEGNFGAAGRMYERLGRRRKAFKMYMKGGYPEEAARLLKKHFFLGGYELAKKAFQDAAEMGKKYAFLQNIGDFYGLRDLKKKEVLSYSALAGAAFITAAAFTHPAIFTTLLVGSPIIAVFCYMCVGAKEYPFVELAVPNFTETSSREKPSRLPSRPAVLSMEEAVKYSCASTEEKAKRLLSEGMVFEAGAAYAKDGMLHKAIECVEMLEEKDAARARELKILLYGKTYLEAEELAKTDPDAAKEILSVLGLRHPTVPALIRCLNHKDEDVRQYTLIALKNIGAPAVPALIERLSDDNYYLRRNVAYVLGKIKDVSAVPALLGALEGEDKQMRCYAAEAFRGFGAPAVPALLNYLKDGDEHVQRTATRALGVIKDVSAVPALIEYLKDKNVRLHAAEALGWIGDRSAVPALLKDLNDEDKQVRCSAAWALGEIKDPSAVPALIERLSDDEHYVRCLAAEALAKIGDASSIPAIVERLKDENAYVQRYAVEALEKIGDASAVPALTALRARLDRKLTQTNEEYWLIREVDYALYAIEHRRLWKRP